MQFEPRDLDFPAFGRKIIDDVSSALGRESSIELRVSPTLPEKIKADERLLSHVFSNLLSNAVKYSPAGTPVSFTVEKSNAEAVFQIRDQGIGIPEQDQERLFNAFHRGRNAQHIAGSGLGLTIVKRCLELHGGTISIESKVGQGTTVTVRLPLEFSSVDAEVPV